MIAHSRATPTHRPFHFVMSPRIVTSVPLGNSAWHVGGQSMPGGSLVTCDPSGTTVSCGSSGSGSSCANAASSSMSRSRMIEHCAPMPQGSLHLPKRPPESGVAVSVNEVPAGKSAEH